MINCSPRHHPPAVHIAEYPLLFACLCLCLRSELDWARVTGPGLTLTWVWPAASLGSELKQNILADSFVDFKPELRNPWQQVCIASRGSRWRIILIEWKIKMLFIPATGWLLNNSK